MYFLAVVLLAPDTRNTSSAVDRLMEPYNYTFGGPPWREYFDRESIERLAVRHHTRATHLKKFAARLTEESGLPFAVDDEGGFYLESSRNPTGRYTTYGRRRGWEGDVWPVSTMPRDLVPGAVVTPDGEWHDFWIGSHDRHEADLRQSERLQIREAAYALIDRYPDYLAVAVYCDR